MPASPATPARNPSRGAERGLTEALLGLEGEIGELLFACAGLEHELATWYRPCLEPRRLRAGSAEEPPPAIVSAPGASGSEIAVVLLCTDEGGRVEEALARLAGQSPAPDEVVVVDAGSEQLETLHRLARLEAGGQRVVRAPAGGAAARNLGVEATRASWVLVLDADAVLVQGSLEAAAALLGAEPGLGFLALEGPVIALGETVSGGLTGVLARAGLGGASLLKREVWRMLGGFDAEVGLHLEQDLQARALVQGFSGLFPGLRLGDSLRPDSAFRAPGPAAHLAAAERLFPRHARRLPDGGAALLEARTLVRDHLRERRDALEQERRQAAAELSRPRREGPLSWEELRRGFPLSHFWGLERGQPVDRIYVEAFLDRHRGDVRGRVLEVCGAAYTRLFGDGEVTGSDVLDLHADNPEATLVADLAAADHLAGDRFDCFILTQTLNVVYDVRGALGHAVRLLTPGGVLLLTVSALNRVTYGPGGMGGDFWRFTEASLRRLFAELLPLGAFEITPYGNLLASTAFLHGMTAEELRASGASEADLAAADPYFPLIYGVRAIKPEAPARASVDAPLESAVPRGATSAERLEAARQAWLDAMGPDEVVPGFVRLPPDGPLLEERHLEGCRVLPHRRLLIEAMAKGATVAEVGVQAGRFSRTILEACRPATLHLIDCDLGSFGIEVAFAEEVAAGRVVLHEGDSAEVLRGLPDGTFDFVYLDADHSYEGVWRDIEAAKPKLREGGFLVFNDYTYWSPAECRSYGVVRAVNELCLAEDWRVAYLALGPYMYCDVAITRS